MPPRKKKPAAGSVGLAAAEVSEGKAPADVARVEARVAEDGGAVLARYRDPLGGHWLVLASLPLDKVEPTPYQRELSEPHVKRLAEVMPKVGRFLDPVVAVMHETGWWTPNGRHRLAALRSLGAKAIVALVVPEHEIALRILALNTEKAHNLKDKATEVMRMERALAAAPDTGKRLESEWAFEFEEAAYATLGLCYEQRPRLAGAVYLPVLKRCDAFLEQPIRKALETRLERAEQVLAVDDAVSAAAARLKEAGFESPYLKAFVVARVNPLRFVKAAKVGEKAPRADFDTTLAKMLASALKLDAGKIRAKDVAVMGGVAAEE